MANRQRFLFAILLMVSDVGALFAISGGFIMYFTVHDELGLSLLVGTAILIVLLMVIAGYLDVWEKKRFGHIDNSPRENTTDEKRLVTEVEEFRRNQEKMNLEAWNTNDFTEPPAIVRKRRK